MKFHPVHPFPARMASSIAWEHLSSVGKQLTVLDPMTGSGTTLMAARLNGHRGFGFDSDPLAVLIANSWCNGARVSKFTDQAKTVLAKAKKGSKRLRQANAYPPEADRETRKFIRYWFDAAARIQLAALATQIRAVSSPTTRDLLWCAFSKTIITKNAGTSLAMDVSHSRPHKAFLRAPVKPFAAFEKAAKAVASAITANHRTAQGPRSIIKRGDARALPVASASVDIIITSPPYLNAIDYMRGHKMSLVWIGHNLHTLRKIRSQNVGTEVSGRVPTELSFIGPIVSSMGATATLPGRVRGMLGQYVYDMDQVVAEIRRVLKPQGKAILVVGNSSIRSTFISNSDAMKLLAIRNGLKVAGLQTRPLPDNRRYLPPPSQKGAGDELGRRMREEVILTFCKN